MPLSRKRNARAGVPGASEVVVDADERPSVAESKPFVDRHGHRLSEHVLRNWSPQILRILGVRRLEGGE
jgi:hypothetical protein